MELEPPEDNAMTSVYQLPVARGQAAPVATSFSPASLADGVARWIRMVAPTEAEVQDTLRRLGLPPDATAPPEENYPGPTVVVCAPAILVTLPVLVSKEGDVGLLRLISTPEVLITVEEQALPSIDRVAADLGRADRAAPTPPGLLLDVLVAVASTAGPLYRAVRGSLDELSGDIEDRPAEVQPDAILALKRRMTPLSLLLEDQVHGLLELRRRLVLLTPSVQIREQLQNLIFDGEYALKLLARMEVRLHELRQHHQHCLQEQTNRRLDMLAILSAIYMPATLIAGVYGMNFEHIPVTEYHYGYFFVVALMMAVVAGQLWYFSRRGWFK
jgi:magnesium transporter